MTGTSSPGSRYLVVSVFLTALTGILYELLLGTVSTFLLGDSVLEWSLTIGLFLSAMGLGSHLSRFVRGSLLPTLLYTEIALGLVGGLCPLLLFAVFSYVPAAFRGALVAVLVLLGTGVGLEIPLLTRMMRQHGALKDILANALAFDYVGALAASLAFPLVLYPSLGLARTAVLAGALNLLVVVILGRQHRKAIALAAAAALVLGAAFGASSGITRFLDDRIFSGEVVYRRDTRHQNIILTLHPEQREIRLLINHHLQFSSRDERRYHEALVHPAMGTADKRRRALVLGGGDGLAVRELVKYPELEHVTLVDIDPEMVALARSHPLLRGLNEGALDDPRVTIVNADAMRWLIEQQKRPEESRFDVVLVDLPDPSTPGLGRLFSREFYALAQAQLAEGGVMAVQSTSPYYAREAFWCIEKTIASTGVSTRPYHVWVPSFGEWGFVLASRSARTPVLAEVPLTFLTRPTFDALFHFPPDMEKLVVDVNTVLTPTLHRYYAEATRRDN